MPSPVPSSNVFTEAAEDDAFLNAPVPKWRKPYYAILEGCGGTLDLPPGDPIDIPYNRNAITRVGTYGCRTYVGVYIKLTERRCFIAHINAYAQDERGDREPPENRSLKSHSEGDLLREAVLLRLREEARTENWPPRKEWLAACVTCPMPAWKDRWLTGLHVLEALQRFIPEPLFQIQPWEAFVVDNWSRGAGPAAVEGFGFVAEEYHGGPMAALNERYESFAHPDAVIEGTWEFRLGNAA